MFLELKFSIYLNTRVFVMIIGLSSAEIAHSVLSVVYIVIKL